MMGVAWFSGVQIPGSWIMSGSSDGPSLVLRCLGRPLILLDCRADLCCWGPKLLSFMCSSLVRGMSFGVSGLLLLLLLGRSHKLHAPSPGLMTVGGNGKSF